MRLVRLLFVSYFCTQTPRFVLRNQICGELFHFDADDWLPCCVTIPATLPLFFTFDLVLIWQNLLASLPWCEKRSLIRGVCHISSPVYLAVLPYCVPGGLLSDVMFFWLPVQLAVTIVKVRWYWEIILLSGCIVISNIHHSINDVISFSYKWPFTYGVESYSNHMYLVIFS